MKMVHEVCSQQIWGVCRFDENPIITPWMLGDADENINGPSLIKTPEWLPDRLGNYYLYFGHHRGQSIRLAYADDLRGPWKIHTPGVVPTDSLSWDAGHISSPDVRIDEDSKELVMYFHTVNPFAAKSAPGQPPKQCTFAATSKDGLVFNARPEALGDFYFRVWKWNKMFYAMPRLASPLLRSKDGFYPFASTPSPFENKLVFENIRHIAVLVENDDLLVFYTRIGDAPESIFMTTVHMTEDWTQWTVDPPHMVMQPETGYEGANLPVQPSQRGMTFGFENALRDPFLYVEDGKYYLLYCVVAERGIAIAELTRLSHV